MLKRTLRPISPAERERYCRTRKRLIITEIVLLAVSAVSWAMCYFLWDLGTVLSLGPVFSAVEYAYVVAIPLAVVHGLASAVFLLRRSGNRTSYHVASIVIYVLGLLPLLLAAWEDAHSNGFLSGLIAVVVMVFIVPCVTVLILVNAILLRLEQRRIRREGQSSKDPHKNAQGSSRTSVRCEELRPSAIQH